MQEFSAATYEAAVAEAERTLGSTADALEIQVVQQGSGGLLHKKPWVISVAQKHIRAETPAPTSSAAPPAAPTAPATPAHALDPGVKLDPSMARLSESMSASVHNAGYQLYYTEEGVLLECDSLIEDAEILRYCLRRGLSGADIGSARQAIARGDSPARLAPPQEPGPPAGEDMAIQISKDEMQAVLTIYPGDPEGEPLTVDKAFSIIESTYKLTHGIDRQAVERAVNAHLYRQRDLVAQGAKAVDGEPAVIEFHFRLTNSMRPTIGEGDRVDYRTLELFVPVQTGQVLVTRTPPTPGLEGYTVRGKLLRPRAGRDQMLPRGKGVEMTEDKLALLATMNGMVSYVNNQVIVTNRYVVEGDLDMGVGNLDFAGDIEVRGNVIQGMVARAQGSIEVHGVVAAASIIAEGNIVLRQGMQGNDRGEVRAGGDVIAKYFERSRVFAGGMVTADAIYHSEVNAVQGVTAAGKFASLIGGITRSAGPVVAKALGSTAHAATVVEVGILPEQRTRFNFLQMEIRRLQAERDKLQMMVKSFGDAPKPDEPPQRAELRARVFKSNQENFKNLIEAQAEHDRLRADMEAATGGRVHVLGTAYPGARVFIGSSVYSVETPIDFATFRMENGEVVFRACEYL